VVEEILDAQRPACPPEYFNIKIPENHSYHTHKPNHSEIPVLRTRYDMRTGFSPNNPRQQVQRIFLYNILSFAAVDAKNVTVIS
jgi:dual oxidase